MRPLQELLPKQLLTGFGQELKTQQAFLLLQEMIQSYFQPFVYVLETNGTGLGLKVVQISLPPPLIPHLGLTWIIYYFGLFYLEMIQCHFFPLMGF